MKTLTTYASMAFVVALGIDVMIILWMLLQIGSGIDTPHIPFWDMQARFIINLVS